MQVNTLQKELDHVEKLRREANEKELPEEQYRVEVEKKKKELNDLMKQFSEMNATKKVEQQSVPKRDTGGERRQYERPSERRKRLEQKRESGDDQYYRETGSGRDNSSHW